MNGDLFVDKEAFVLGNGPSLAEVDLQNLDPTVCFGMNAAYRFWDKIDWYPEYYVCLDPIVLSSHRHEVHRLIKEARVKSFFLEGSFFIDYPEYVGDPRFLSLDQVIPNVRLKSRGMNMGFEPLAYQEFSQANPSLVTTGSWAVRYASAIGFSKITTLGIDLKYTEVLPEAQSVEGFVLELKTTPTKNPNYFFDDYQREGDHYQIPNPEVHTKNLHIAAFEDIAGDVARGNMQVEIFNGSRRSILAENRIFPFRENEKIVGLSSLVIPLTVGEIESLLNNFRLWNDARYMPFFGVSPKVKPRLIVVFNKKHFRTIKRVRAAFETHKLARFFSGLDVIGLGLKKSDDLYLKAKPNFRATYGWRTGPANLFFKCLEIAKSYGGFTYVMETDCVAVSPNWLGELDKICRENSKSWIIGSVYRGSRRLSRKYLKHINGSSMYNVGSEGFRQYLTSFWRESFFILSKTNPLLNYDLVMEYALDNAADSEDKVDPGDKAWNIFQESAHNFTYTDKIVNVSGDDFSVSQAKNLLVKMPNAVVIHNRVVGEMIFQAKFN